MSSSVAALKAAADAKFREGDYQGAVTQWQAAARLLPEDAADADTELLGKLHANCGMALLKLGKPAQGKQACLEASRLRPVGKVFYRLGRCHEDLGEASEAAACFKKAAKLTPNDALVKEAVIRTARPRPPPPPAAPSAAAAHGLSPLVLPPNADGTPTDEFARLRMNMKNASGTDTPHFLDKQRTSVKLVSKVSSLVVEGCVERDDSSDGLCVPATRH